MVEILLPDTRPDAEMVGWHGLSVLLMDGPLRALDRAHADRVGRQLLDHVEAGLLPEARRSRGRGVTG